MADGTNGADTFNGTAIADLYNGLDGNDTIYGNSGNDTLNGDGGADVIYGGNDDDSIRGGLGNDSLYGDAGNDTLSGGEDDDYLGDYQGSNSLDGGAGRDYFEYVGYGSGVDTLTGGAGSDTFSLYYPFSNGYVADIVTDFATGTGGDVLRLDYLGLSMASGVNPFLAGYLRLVQVGTAVQLQGDQNGGGDNWRTLLVLENTVATAFTAANFQPGYSPTGAGAVLDGNDSANNIVGTVNADTINGLGGNDTIDGREGDDSIDGGAGNDNLDGGYGNDTILGGTGSDTIYGGQGNDSMVGGDGQDYFGSDDGNDTQRGGDGDDRLGDYQGSNVLDGGAGADYFEYVGYGSGVDTLSGGAGSDVFNLYYAFSSSYVADIVTDFTTGTGGDVIRLNALGLSGLASGANPFTTGFLRLVQVGGAVELQGDQNGGGNEWRTLLVLQNTTVGAFTGANFDPGYSPTGTGLVLTGSDGANGIVGTVDGDTISGLGGNDTIDGNAGDDLIDGGSGNDQISGGQGADTITAGIGRDTIYAGDGNDVIAGDDGSDYLYGEGGNDSLSGGLGEDTLDGGTGDDTLLGGDGDDYLADYQGANSVSGGAGADYFEYVGHNTGVDTLTGGAGIDTFNLYYPFSAGYAADIVTDFATGTGGDVIRLSGIGFSGLPSGANPFTTGYLRLVQVGANTELQGDQNGGGDGWKTILVLQNVTATNLTSSNFEPAYSPNGAGIILNGNENANSIAGTVDGDTILGLGGNDTISGNAGNDSIDGGTGNDVLYGNLGNDTVIGGSGNDTLYGNDGDDSLSGGDGQDTLVGEAGNDTLLGGDGDDYLYDYEGANSLSGGAGADYFDYVGCNTGVDTLTGGTGSDTFSLYYPFDARYVADIVTDFATGTGGDVISLNYVNFSGLGSGVNPFTSGHLRLVQVGANTELQGDQNGGGDNWKTLLVLQNVAASSVTGANFSSGYSPTASGATLTGNDTANNIEGSVDGDTILGLGGNDTIDGNAGNDSIDGGTGNDNLTGDLGNDTLLGGAGNDTLYGNDGDDSLSGGDGQDRLEGNAGNDTLLGGDGDDYLGDYEGANSLSGGAGADYFDYVGYNTGIDTLTGGAGIDTFNLYYPFGSGYVADIVTDFATGTGGDVISLGTLGLSGLGSGVNPFTSGHLRLVQVGANTELQGDQNGGGDNWRTLLILQNTSVGSFTSANFSPSPTGSAGVSQTGGTNADTLTGTDGNDTLSGLGGNDTILGLGGNDNLDGGADNDSIAGGDGNDYVTGGAGADSITGDAGNDTVYGNAGNDTIDGGIGNDNLNGDADDDRLSGGEGQDSLYGGTGNDTLLGGDGDDYFDDSQGANSQSGGAGADLFAYVGYGTGIDTLTGGAGIDTFSLYFPTNASYVADVVTDFATGRGGDVIRLDNVGFSGLGGRNPFTAGFMQLVQVGADTELRIDQDGGGNNYKTVLILQNTVATAFAAANFDPAYSPTGTGLTIDGSALSDNLAGDVDGDTINGFDGNDAISGNGGNDSIAGGGGNDTISGNVGNDTIDGGSGNDTLYGNEGDDSLSGGDGQDRLEGGAGNDTLLGGDGDDYFNDSQGANSQSGGAGADYFDYVGYGTSIDTLTGGAGTDTFNLYYPTTASYVADVVTDFTTGRGGDVVRLNDAGFSGLGDRNPFTAGFMRLVQVGADTELRIDQNGGGDNYKTVLILQNTVATAFTAANFEPAYSPTGTGLTIDGTALADNLIGSVDGDTISGFDGNDAISGNGGNDSIAGGGGNDTIYGNAGNDTIDGGSGNDTLYGNEGDDLLSGGDGQDRFTSEAGNDTFLGGDGDDYFTDAQGANSMNGGAGADYFDYVGNGNGVDTLTGGAGVDTFNLYYPVAQGYVADIVTDFTTGTGGDILRLDALGLSGLGDRNPFTTGYITLVQVGADTEVRVDADGGGNSFKTVLILQNTTATSFTAANFLPAYSPTGAGQVITGTPQPDGLNGTPDGDTITGLDGNDTIDGGGGDDLIDAGTGADNVSGGAGNDTIDGGAGNDTLSGNAGNDVLTGGVGNDNLNGNEGDDSLSGGDGEDRFNTEAGNDTFLGGDSDDYFGDYQGANSVNGGAGADYFEYVGYGNGVDTLTGGAGVDTFNLFYPVGSGYVADIVTDFTAGAGGDILRLDNIGFSNLGDRNPFTAGFMQLVQVGADTELRVDTDGGGDNFKTVLILRGTTASSLTAANFDPAYSPTGTGLTITGTPLQENLVGTPDGDTITGLEGNDTITGNGGNDVIDGGAGNDTLYGNAGNDTVSGGIGNDTLYGNEGDDSLSGGEGQDRFTVEAGNDTFRGGDGDDYLGDYQGANVLDGGAGEDYFEYVSYAAGVDTLTGGAGVDTFNLYATDPSYAADIVTDFATGSGGDVLRLSGLGFSNLASGANPFLTGHLRLFQSGADTLLQVDRDGGGDGYSTVLVLQNTNASAFTGVNFDPAYDPTGVGITFIGTPQADSFFGSPNADRAEGRDSNDTLDGNAGDDTMLGEGGNDYLYGDEGNDSLDGGIGNDYLVGGADNDVMIGGSGNDTLYGNAGNDTLTGGDGDDYLYDHEGANSLSGGAGADYFELVSYGNGVDTLTGGAGTDIYNINSSFSAGSVADIVTDFSTGIDGDIVRLSSLGLSGVPAGGNPFLTGHLRLVQVGADVQLQGDANGGGDAYQTLLVFQNTNKAAFAAANFDPPFDPSGVAVNTPPTAVADAVTVGEDGATTIAGATLLANDTDPDANDTKTIQSVPATSSAGASLSLVGGNVVYDPGSRFNGLGAGQTATDSFTYTMRDAAGATSSATVTVTITGANDAPTAVADAIAIGEDGGTIAGATLLANDTDPDGGDSKAIQSVSATSTQGANLSLVNGNVVYDPGTRFNGLRAGQTATDSFTYTMRDAGGLTSSATVTVTINGANDAPVAVADAVAVDEDATTGNLVATLLGNDTDPDLGDSKTIVSVDTTGTLGTVTFDAASQRLTFTADDPSFDALDPGQTATTTFTYTMRDAGGLTSTATVTMTVNGVDNDARPNTPPTAVADAVTVGEDGATTIAGATLLANDTDPDANDTKAIQSVSATSTAGASMSLVNGNVVYDPGTRFNYLRASQTATDTFTYTMRDTAGATSTATVTVTITGANDAPTATADAVTVTEEGGTILAAALLGNDTDPDAGDTKTIQSVSATSAEGASVSLVNGDVVYDPGTRFNGLGVGQTATDSFTYTMRDALGLTSSATVTVTITGANDTPTANADSVTAAEDGATTIAGATLLANDTDADAGDTKTIQSVSGTSAQGASVSLVNGNVVYDPGTRFDSLGAGQTATDTFNYTMHDTAGATSTTTVTVTVIGANDTPIAVADNVTAAEDGTSTITGATLLGNDIDPDAGDTRTIQSVSATSTQGASVSLVNGNVVYDPGTRFNGLRAGQTATDTFTYTMRDAAGATSTATVTVTINGANDAPVAVADAVAVDEDATTGNLVTTLLGNDTDPDLGDSKTIVSVDTTGTLGTVAFDAASQRLTFTADDPSFDALDTGQTATTTFTYTMRDAGGLTSTATVTMTVNGVDNDARPNTPPTAVADAVTVGEDGATTIADATLLANDTDPDAGDTKSIQSVSGTSSQGASVSLVNGNVVYDPGTRFNGLRAGQTATDSFTYTMRDTAGATSNATVTVTINGANDAPVAVGDAAVVDEDATTGNLVAALLANDTDPDLGDSRMIVSVDTTGTRGTVAFDAATQMLTFTADDPSFDALAPGETTTTAFTYTMRDAAGATSTGTVTMTVNGVDNDDDYIYGTNGNDVFEGGAGRDLYRGLAGNDVIRGNGGDDRIEAGDGNDVISGGMGNNLLFGQGGNDTFGNDLLVGTNLFDGGTGIDTLVTTASAGQSVTVNLLLGTVVGGTYDGSTVVGIENLRNGSSSTSVTYIGDDGANVLTGGAAADVLRGGGGADQLSGGAGADILDGGAGADVLSGGMGNDTFVLRAGQTNGDRILDFNGNGAGPGDTLVFEGFGADATLTNVGNVFTITYGAGLTETFTLNTALLHPSDYIFFG